MIFCESLLHFIGKLVYNQTDQVKGGPGGGSLFMYADEKGVYI